MTGCSAFPPLSSERASAAGANGIPPEHVLQTEFGHMDLGSGYFRVFRQYLEKLDSDQYPDGNADTHAVVGRRICGRRHRLSDTQGNPTRWDALPHDHEYDPGRPGAGDLHDGARTVFQRLPIGAHHWSGVNISSSVRHDGQTSPDKHGYYP